jgi:hypothetical protein
MKTIKYFVLIITILLIISCSKHKEKIENDTCTSDCTIFKGRIETADKIGIPNVRVNLSHRSDNWVLVSVSDLGETYTDSEGYYELKTYIDDMYLGYHHGSSFDLTINNADIDDEISRDYLKPKQILYYDLEVDIWQINKRDTIYTNDFVVPKRGELIVKLNNYQPTEEHDAFEVGVIFQYDFLSPGWCYDNIYYQASLSNTTSSKVFRINTVLDDDIFVSIWKRKNGKIEETDTIIHLTNSNPYMMEFEY